MHKIYALHLFSSLADLEGLGANFSCKAASLKSINAGGDMSTKPESLTIILTAALTYYIKSIILFIGLSLDWLTKSHTTNLLNFNLAIQNILPLIFIVLILVMFHGKNWAKYVFSILLPLRFIYFLVLNLNFYISNWQTNPYIHASIYNSIFWQLVDLATILLFVLPLYSQKAIAYFNKQSSK